MLRALLLNIALNAALGAALVGASAWALRSGLEETHVALALIFGLATTAANALFVAAILRRRR